MKKKKNEQTAFDKIAVEIAKDYSKKDETDVLGSYTGVPEDKQQPVQDVDDL